jgi:hypothetical protein
MDNIFYLNIDIKWLLILILPYLPVLCFHYRTGTIAGLVQPQTKYINCKYHHFRSHIGKTITIHKIDTSEQIVDLLTKPLEEVSFCKFQDIVMGHKTLLTTALAERESERILDLYGKALESPGRSSRKPCSILRQPTFKPASEATLPLDPGEQGRNINRNWWPIWVIIDPRLQVKVFNICYPFNRQAFRAVYIFK